MANYLFQPLKMGSQFNDAKLRTVLVKKADAEVAVHDGALVVLGGYANDPVYTGAFTAAAGQTKNVADYNVRVATAPANTEGKGLCVVDIADVPTATNGTNVYRIGVQTVNMTAAAGVPVRARILEDEDAMIFGDANFAGVVGVNGFATATAGATTLTPAAEAPVTGNYFTIDGTMTISQGATADVTAYVLTYHVG